MYIILKWMAISSGKYLIFLTVLFGSFHSEDLLCWKLECFPGSPLAPA